jgi:hypothetical protein
MYLQEIRKAADVDGIDLAEDWDKQWGFVNLVMKKIVFIIFQELTEGILASQGGLHSMELVS